MEQETKYYNLEELYIYNFNHFSDKDEYYSLVYYTGSLDSYYSLYTDSASTHKGTTNHFKNLFPTCYADAYIEQSESGEWDDFYTKYNFKNFIDNNDIVNIEGISLDKENYTYEELNKIWPSIQKGIILGRYHFPLTDLEEAYSLIPC